MKILISESQLRFVLSEQTSDEWGGVLGTIGAPVDFDYKNIGSAVTDLSINFYKKHPDIVTFGSFFIPYIGPYISGALVADQTVDAWNSAETTEEKSIIALGVACNVMFGIKLGVNATSSTVLNNLKRKSFKIIADKLKSNNLNKLTPNEVNIVSEMGKHKEEISIVLQQKVKPKISAINIKLNINKIGTQFVEMNGKIIGEYQLTIKGNEAYLNDVVIYNKGQGIGTQVYIELIGKLKEQGIKLISTNYEKHGTAISPQSISIWQKLESIGKAKKIGEIKGNVLDRSVKVNGFYKSEIKIIPIYKGL